MPLFCTPRTVQRDEFEVDEIRGFQKLRQNDFPIVRGVGCIVRETAVAVSETDEARVLNSRGFFLNILNPANFFEWVGAAGVLKTKYHFAVFENISFFTGALLAVFCTGLSVAYFASRLRKVLNDKVMSVINIVTGSIFLGFGVWLLWEAAH